LSNRRSGSSRSRRQAKARQKQIAAPPLSEGIDASSSKAARPDVKSAAPKKPRPSRGQIAVTAIVVVIMLVAIGSHVALLVDSSAASTSQRPPIFALEPLHNSTYAGAIATDMHVDIERPTRSGDGPLGGPTPDDMVEMDILMDVATPVSNRLSDAASYTWRLVLPKGTLGFSTPLIPESANQRLVQRKNGFGQPVTALQTWPIYLHLWQAPTAGQKYLDLDPVQYQFDSAPGDPTSHRDLEVVAVRLIIRDPLVSSYAGLGTPTQTKQIEWKSPIDVPSFIATRIPDSVVSQLQIWKMTDENVPLNANERAKVDIEVCSTCNGGSISPSFDTANVTSVNNAGLARAVETVDFGGNQLIGWTVAWQPWWAFIVVGDWLAAAALTYIVGLIFALAWRTLRGKPAEDSKGG